MRLLIARARPFADLNTAWPIILRLLLLRRSASCWTAETPRAIGGVLTA